MTLNVHNNTLYGFLRVTVQPSSILCESLGVNESTGKTSYLDQFTVDLTKHVVLSAAFASKTRAGATIKPKVPPRKKK